MGPHTQPETEAQIAAARAFRLQILPPPPPAYRKLHDLDAAYPECTDQPDRSMGGIQIDWLSINRDFA